MTALRDEIANLIAHEGPITVEHYMSLCLSHPEHGYYMTHDPFGASGDFVTAPEISQMFGELLGLWAIEAWRAAGALSPVRLVELGPGRGTLMSDVLRVAPVSPEFAQAIDVRLVETSPALEGVQRRTLASFGRLIGWSGDFENVPSGPAIILANEFFDALPVRHFVRAGRSWRERLVGLDHDGALVFGLSGYAEPDLEVDAPEGAIIEIGAVALGLMADIARRVVEEGGALLVTDYGYLETSLGETLQAVEGHAYADPLADPGAADITAHVDFAALARAAKAQGAKVLGPVTQGRFLDQLGIVQRAETLARHATSAQRSEIASALERLAGSGDARTHMGDVFKAMAVVHPDMPDLPGFF